jgi:hypothetical protein
MNAKEILDSEYSAKEINEMAEWLNELSFEQLMFLKDSYESMLQVRAQECNSTYVQ